MKNISVVEKIEQNYVVVSTARDGGCGENCVACKACAADRVTTKAICEFKVEVGDVVLIESNTLSVLVAMLVVFILPLVLPLLLYLFVGVLGACIGLIVAIALIFIISRSDVFLKMVTPKIISIINKK